jgi:hypothetical protein
LRMHGNKREQQENRKQKGAADHSVDSFGVDLAFRATSFASAVLTMGSYSITKWEKGNYESELVPLGTECL